MNSLFFPLKLKLANIRPVLKKTSPQKAQKTITNLSVFYQIFLWYTRSLCLENVWIFWIIFIKILVWILEEIQCPTLSLEKGKSPIDNWKTFGALLTDLSKAFGCLSHDILTAKLIAYGLSIAALRLVQNYLSNRKQRTKTNSDFSFWEEILFGVHQGSILGPLLFNIFLCELFFIMNETRFSADDNTATV